MGSTVVKELRGTESTRKSIQKLKRGERLGGGGNLSTAGAAASTSATTSSSTTSLNSTSGYGSSLAPTATGIAALPTISPNNTTLSAAIANNFNNTKKPLLLSISHRGVQFIDNKTQVNFLNIILWRNVFTTQLYNLY